MRVVIAGTGTEIGKTHVTACLLASGRAQGRRLAAYKPIASGVADTCEDAERHAQALEAAYVPPSFAYRRPVSPHLAAREEGRPIDLAVIRRRADEMAAGVDDLVIEAAGGLFTPLGDRVTNVELIQQLGLAHVVLVAPDRLGVLHEVGVCITAARASNIQIAAVVLSAPTEADDSTGTNASELASLGLAAPIAGVFPRARFDAPESRAVATLLWMLLRDA